MPYDIYKVNLPETRLGEWSIRKLVITEKEAEFAAMRAVFHGGRGTIEPGTYTALYRGGTLVMSDTPDEIRDHIGFIFRASGRVLIAGLGLGMVVRALLEKPDVTHVTVIELSPEVCTLVGMGLKAKYGDRLTIVNSDALTWKPVNGERWDHAWYDIWDTICSDHVPQMTKLKRRFGRRVGHQACWCEWQMKRNRGSLY